jgi:hypothetical protein
VTPPAARNCARRRRSGRAGDEAWWERLGLDTAFAVRQIRDLLLWSDGSERVYVAACDVNAGVGERTGDFLHRPPEEAGYNAGKVVLMEICATGAKPLFVMNTLCVPRDAYGERVVDGIRRVLAESKMSVSVSGSDETNMKTVQTGVGVMAVGLTDRNRLMVGRSRPGDVVICAGVPKDGVGREYREGDADVAAVTDLIDIVGRGVADEVLPVGSRGILSELHQLAEVADLEFELDTQMALDLSISAGASTCFLVSCPPWRVDEMRCATRLPTYPVAILRAAAGDNRR